MAGLPLWKPTPKPKVRKPLRSTHELLFMERIGTCECGWQGPMSEFQAHQWAAANKDLVQVLKDTIRPRRRR